VAVASATVLFQTACIHTVDTEEEEAIKIITSTARTDLGAKQRVERTKEHVGLLELTHVGATC